MPVVSQLFSKHLEGLVCVLSACAELQEQVRYYLTPSSSLIHNQSQIAISTTCKSLHAIIIREALWSVNLTTLRGIDRFPDFVFADPSQRIPLLRRISVDTKIASVLASEPQLLQKFASFLAPIFSYPIPPYELNTTISCSIS